jgi:hypothetical protein
MSISHQERHHRLRRRLRFEMQQSRTSGNGGPAAARADRSMGARTSRVRELREGQQSQDTAAASADVPRLNIPQDLLRRFRPIPENDGGVCPPTEFITPQQQDFLGENMGLPMEVWPSLIKKPVLTLPQTLTCSYWMDWACANQCLPPGAGCMLMHPNTYESELQARTSMIALDGTHTPLQQDIQIRAHGYPYAVWRWIVTQDTEEPMSDNDFELISTSDLPVTATESAVQTE